MGRYRTNYSYVHVYFLALPTENGPQEQQAPPAPDLDF